MPIYTTPAGTPVNVPSASEIADGPKAFADFADSLDAFLPPVGTIVPYGGGASVGDWLLCDGSAIDPKYTKLINIVGANTPNLKGRFLVGMNIGDEEFASVGTRGGAKTVGTSSTITTSNLPQHTHTASGTVTVSAANAAHSHGAASTSSVTHSHVTGYRTVGRQSSSGNTNVPINEGSNDDRTGDNSHSHTFNVGNADANHTHGATVSLTVAQGGGVPSPAPLSINISTLSPYHTVNYLIRAA